MHDQGPNKNPPSLIPELFPNVALLGEKELLWASSGPFRFSFPGLNSYEGLHHSVFTRKTGTDNRTTGEFDLSFGGGQAGSVVSSLHQVRVTVAASSLVIMRQTHSDQVAALNQVPKQDIVQYECDAVISPFKGVGLLVRTADCQGVLLYDPEANVVAAVHCGWRGAVQNILAKTVETMVREFGSGAGDIRAAIGPSLGPCCGEFKGYRNIFPVEFRDFMGEHSHFDMWAVSCGQLKEAGLREENIEVATLCTKCNTHLFYSYRADKSTGRFGAAIALC